MTNQTDVEILMQKYGSYNFKSSPPTLEDSNFAAIIWNIIHNKYTGSWEMHEDVYLYNTGNTSDNLDTENNSDSDKSDSDKKSTSSYEPLPEKKQYQTIAKNSIVKYYLKI